MNQHIITLTFITAAFLFLLPACQNDPFLSQQERNTLFAPPTPTESNNPDLAARIQEFLSLL